MENSKKNFAKKSIEELIDLILELQKENIKLKKENEALKAELLRLKNSRPSLR